MLWLSLSLRRAVCLQSFIYLLWKSDVGVYGEENGKKREQNNIKHFLFPIENLSRCRTFGYFILTIWRLVVAVIILITLMSLVTLAKFNISTIKIGPRVWSLHAT